MMHFFHCVAGLNDPVTFSRVLDGFCALKGRHSIISLKNEFSEKAYFKNTDLVLHGIESIVSSDERRDVIDRIIKDAGESQIIIYHKNILGLFRKYLHHAVIWVDRGHDIGRLLSLYVWHESSRAPSTVIVTDFWSRLMGLPLVWNGMCQMIRHGNSASIPGTYQKIWGTDLFYDERVISERKAQCHARYAAEKR